MKEFLILAGCFVFGLVLGLLILKRSIGQVRKKYDRAMEEADRLDNSENT